MFGYVRARRDTLSRETLADYEAVYCGLCHTLGQRYGLRARMFLNYDFAFLAMLLASSQEKRAVVCRGCPRHPIEGKQACVSAPWLELAADESVILTWWKLRDTVADSGRWKGLTARACLLSLKKAYGRAKEARPMFDSAAAQLLEQLGRLEEERCTSIDRTADTFAQLLAAAAPATGEHGRDRALEQLLYHLGRWIYLIDAVDDLEEDREKGRYNPILARFPDWKQEDRDYLRQNLDQSIGLIGAAFQLLPPNPWTHVVENVIYSGLPGVEELVFTGRWRKDTRKHRRDAHE